MNRPFRLLAPSTIAVAAATVLASPAAYAIQSSNPYIGNGSLRPDLVRSGYAAKSVEAFDLDGDGRHEMLHLDAGGRMTVFERFAEHNRRLQFDGISACAVLHGSPDRVFCVDSQGALNEVQFSSDGSSASLTMVELAGLSNVTYLASTVRPGGSRLLAIDQGGTRAVVLEVQDALTFLRIQSFSGFTVPLRDVDLVDWDHDGTDELAVVTQQGLKVLNASGGLVQYVESIAPRSFAEVLPGAKTQWGHDILLFHHLMAPGYQHAWILARNSAHEEWIFVDPLQISSIEAADITDAPGSELVLPCGAYNSAIFVSQFTTSSEAAARFGIDFSQVNWVDCQLESSVPNGPAALDSADLDGDGDDDLVFFDNRGTAMVVTPERFDGNARRIVPAFGFFPQGNEPGKYRWEFDASAPNGSTTVQVEIWFAPSLQSQATFLASTEPTVSVVTANGVTHSGVVGFVDFLDQSGDGGIYFMLSRPVTTTPGVPPFPSTIQAWSPDGTTMDALFNDSDMLYPWAPVHRDSVGGTTERPAIDPGTNPGSGTTPPP